MKNKLYYDLFVVHKSFNINMCNSATSQSGISTNNQSSTLFIIMPDQSLTFGTEALKILNVLHLNVQHYVLCCQQATDIGMRFASRQSPFSKR